mgnify:CR=1 FL=1
MNEQQRATLVETWLTKSDSALRDARLLKENGSLSACVNRLYYAAFYAVSAVLASRNQSYGKHSAVRAAVHRDFVKTGLLSKEHGRTYDILLSRREQADYQPAVTFEPDEVHEYFVHAREMVAALKGLAAQQ